MRQGWEASQIICTSDWKLVREAWGGASMSKCGSPRCIVQLQKCLEGLRRRHDTPGYMPFCTSFLPARLHVLERETFTGKSPHFFVGTLQPPQADWKGRPWRVLCFSQVYTFSLWSPLGEIPGSHRFDRETRRLAALPVTVE